MPTQTENPGYYAVLPAEVRYDKNLSLLEKMLFAEITALSNKEGFCWAGNRYFADLYDRNEKYISGVLANLAKKGYIRIDIDKAAGNVRKIYIGIQEKLTTYSEKPEEGYSEKPEHNTTSLNTKSITKTKYTDDDVRLVGLMFELMKKNNPSMNKVPTPSDYETMRKIREIDDKQVPVIEAVIRWSQQHQFWHTNILSVKKLRIQFDRLVLQARSELNKNQTVEIS